GQCPPDGVDVVAAALLANDDPSRVVAAQFAILDLAVVLHAEAKFSPAHVEVVEAAGGLHGNLELRLRPAELVEPVARDRLTRRFGQWIGQSQTSARTVYPSMTSEFIEEILQILARDAIAQGCVENYECRQIVQVHRAISRSAELGRYWYAVERCR